MNQGKFSAWLFFGLISTVFVLLAGSAQAYDYYEGFENWPADPVQCEWRAVWGGTAPASCNGTGMLNPENFTPQTCRSGSRCLPFSYSGKDETHNILPKMQPGNNNNFTGTPPNGFANGGYFSYYMRVEPGFVWPENSMKTARMLTNPSSGENAMISEIIFDGTTFENRAGLNPTTACNISFPFHAKNGQWIRLEWFIDRPSKTLKAWVTSEDGTKGSCVNTNMNYSDDTSSWNNWWLGGNYSSARPSGSGFGGRGAWDDVCVSANESARTGFCAPTNFPANTGGGSGGGGTTTTPPPAEDPVADTPVFEPSTGAETTIACSTNVGGLLFCDGFEQGVPTGFSDGGGQLTVQQSIVGYGSHALTGTIPVGGETGGYLSAFFADNPHRPGGQAAKVEDLWFSMRVRFDSGFDHSNVAKIATVGAFEDWNALYPQPWPFAPFYMSVIVNTDKRVFAQIHRKTNGDQWQDIYHQGTQLKSDTWHDLIFHLKLNTPGASDGVIEMWTDGVQDMVATDVNFRDDYTAKGWNLLTLSSWHTTPAQTVSTQFWDELVITSQPLDESAVVQPLAAPVLLE